jgi:hypothetical protein
VEAVIDKATKKIFSSLTRLSSFNADLMERSARWYNDSVADGSKLANFNSYLMERWVNGGFSPLVKSLAAAQRDITEPFMDWAFGERQIGEFVQEIGKRTTSGTRYRKLVHTLGKELFGTARFEGEEVIGEDDCLTLTHIPTPEGVEPHPEAALFHVGGFIPYGDRVFRFLPESNLYLPFLQRGLPVYTMEVKPDARPGDLRRMTLENLVETVDAMSAAAFEHHGNRKMVIEGYCGLGLPMLSFLAARPAEADARFSVAMLMAAPVDARECTLIGEMLETLPDPLLSTNLTLAGLYGRYTQSTALRLAIDIPVNTYFYKTRAGQFLHGWKRHEYAEVESVEDLKPDQRLELAGAYWISPRTFSRHPIPADFLRLFTRLWQEGLDEDLKLPCTIGGQQLSLRTIVEQTQIQLVGIYGGEDRLIPEQTARILERTVGERYTHVVHPKVGHVTYIVVAAMWNKALPFAFKPNPIDVVLERYAGAA